MPTAHAALWQVLGVAGLAVVAIVVTMFVGGRGGSLSGPGLLALVGVSLTGITAAGMAVRRFGRVQLAELQRGYTTTEYRLGRWWMRAAADERVTVGHLAAPTRRWRRLRAVARPGPAGSLPLAPATGALELWTGHQWSGYVPTDPRG